MKEKILLIFTLLMLTLPEIFSVEVRDTVVTSGNDKIILSYRVSESPDGFTVDFLSTRIIPSPTLERECKGELGRLKVVAFERVGEFGKVKWKGIAPEALMVPAGVNYKMSPEGFNILGESGPLYFSGIPERGRYVSLPLYIALYEKKQNYRLLSYSTSPLQLKLTPSNKGRKASAATPATEQIAVYSSEELEGDNEATLSALASINLIKELLVKETEVPFSTTLQAELNNLILLKNSVKDPEVGEKINELLLEVAAREKELKQNQTASAKAQQEELEQRQKEAAEQERLQMEEEQKLRDEQQQKRTIWIIVAGLVVAVLGFIGKAVFKHFQDLRNQEKIEKMQASLMAQAQNEAKRRARETVTNQAYSIEKNVKTQVRNKVVVIGEKTNKTNRKVI